MSSGTLHGAEQRWRSMNENYGCAQAQRRGILGRNAVS